MITLTLTDADVCRIVRLLHEEALTIATDAGRVTIPEQKALLVRLSEEVEWLANKIEREHL